MKMFFFSLCIALVVSRLLHGVNLKSIFPPAFNEQPCALRLIRSLKRRFTEGVYKKQPSQGTPMLPFCNSHPELNDSAGCESATQDARRSQCFSLRCLPLFQPVLTAGTTELVILWGMWILKGHVLCNTKKQWLSRQHSLEVLAINKPELFNV